MRRVELSIISALNFYCLRARQIVSSAQRSKGVGGIRHWSYLAKEKASDLKLNAHGITLWAFLLYLLLTKLRFLWNLSSMVLNYFYAALVSTSRASDRLVCISSS